MTRIYLDYNATTPLDSEVAEAMKPYLTDFFGNPSSTHWFGIQTKKAVEEARKQVANLINCKPDEIIFTSGGTESNNHAIKGIAFAYKTKGNHIITSAIEHPAVIEVCKYLEEKGFKISYIPVDDTGLVDVKQIENCITSQTILITIMHANNEVGTIQPISNIAEIAKKNRIIMHTDAAQSLGKIPVDIKELGVDLLSIAGHKIYAPKGTGALFIQRGINLDKLIHGASHEQNMRAGTENVLEIVGLGKACEIAKRDLSKNLIHMKKMRDLLFDGLREKIKEIKLNGHPENHLPNTLSISFPNIQANTLLSEIESIAASAGAACHSDSLNISPVLTAMNVPPELAMGTIRFSTGRFTSENEIEEVIKLVTDTVNRFKPSDTVELQTINKQKVIKLTHFTHGLGCACKLSPGELEKIVKDFPIPQDPNVLVATDSQDDAAVYKINKNIAIVQTVDFFTPIVDDPYYFGAIATANALSDIYAMGAKPLFALNIVGFPVNRLPMDVLKQILNGAQDKAKEAGISILGGHTIEDTELKYGMVVTGSIDPNKILKNSNAQVGDAIIITKPLGVGIISTALKRGLVNKKTEEYVIKIMSELNNRTAEIMDQFPVNACTDVTGFGLLGHLREMSISSKVDAEIYLDKVPVIPEAWEFATGNIIPGGTLNNLNHVSTIVEWDDNISEIARIILCDAQTSGGLLIAIPDDFTDQIIEKLLAKGIINTTKIGVFTREGEGKISVKK